MFSVKLEVSRAAVSRGLTMHEFETTFTGVVAPPLGETIRERVQGHADLAGQPFPGWSTKRRWQATAPGYPDRAAGQVGPSGAEWYRTAAEYHAANATVPGSYSTTGGMWSGLSAVLEGARTAKIMFRGRSTGRSPNFKQTKKLAAKTRRNNRSGTNRAAALQINNAFKAWTVLRQHRVNVLALAEREVEALALASVHGVALGYGHDVPVQWESPLPATLGEIVRQALRARA
jgi:hypothetical protein